MKDREWEIDFLKIWKALRSNALCILAFTAEGALAVLLGTMLLHTPQYAASAILYVSNGAPQVGAAISSGDLAASKTLVDSYGVLLQTRETLDLVCAYAGISKTWEEVQDMIRTAPVESTEFFQVTVTGPDAYEAEQIANAVAQVLPYQASRVMETSSAKIVDSAIAPSQPVSPRLGRNALLGGLAGLLFALAYGCAESVLDTTIRSRRDMEAVCTYPILAEISQKHGYAEGCKLLRTKLAFLLEGQKGTHILGITSSVRGEGKNPLAEHLVRSLAKSGKQVLLVDCDIRKWKDCKGARPLGLTDYLSGRSELAAALQQQTWGKVRFCLMPAGEYRADFPELLSSDTMTKLLESVRGSYDYVVLNLPVMAEAGDTLSLAGKTDGILLTVHRDVCRREDLEYALKQLEFMETAILGSVYQDGKAAKAKRNQPARTLAGFGRKLKAGVGGIISSAVSDRSSSGTQPSGPR